MVHGVFALPPLATEINARMLRLGLPPMRSNALTDLLHAANTLLYAPFGVGTGTAALVALAPASAIVALCLRRALASDDPQKATRRQARVVLTAALALLVPLAAGGLIVPVALFSVP